MAVPAKGKVVDFLKQQGVTRATFQPMLDIVTHPQSGLSDHAREMLLAALPFSLCVPAEERIEAQAAIVRMLGGVVQTIQDNMQKSIDLEAEKAGEVEAQQAELREEVARAEAAQAEALATLKEHEERQAEALAVLDKERDAVIEAKALEKSRHTELEQIKGHRSEMETVLSEAFEKLRDGKFEENEAEILVQTVQAAAASLGLEESLLIALSRSLMMKQRGTFDNAVIGELERALQDKVATLTKAEEEATERHDAQVADMQRDRTALEAAEAAHTEALEQTDAAQALGAVATAATEAAKGRLAEREPEFAASTAAREERLAALEEFKAYHTCVFGLLRDRVPKKFRGPGTPGGATSNPAAAGAMTGAMTPAPAAEATTPPREGSAPAAEGGAA